MSDERFDGVVKTAADGRSAGAFLPVLYAPDSHAANLAELDNGDLLCVWFNGPGEGDPATNVVLSRLAEGADRWTRPTLVAEDPDHSEQNPVLAQDAAGRVWLWHTSNEAHDQRTARVIVRMSDDRGYTWSEPRVRFEGPGIFLRNPPLRLSDGSWLLPAYYCRSGADHSVVEISPDGGRTWNEHDVPGSDHRIQMSAVQRPDGTLLAVFRSRDADRIWAAESGDLGRSWSPPQRTELPNNNSAIQLVKLNDATLALVYNDASLERDQFRWVGPEDRPRKKAVRTPLTVALSEDGGTTWPYRRNVQTADLEYRDNQAGYSYPSIIQAADGRLHVAYSYLRRTIRHVAFDADWVKGGAGA